jgi:hypothetical protein
MPTSELMGIFTGWFLKENLMLGTFHLNGPSPVIYYVINVPNAGLSLESRRV